jgi:hypothetical protein
VPQHIRLTPPALADDFVSSLRAAGASAVRRGRTVVIDDLEGGEPEGRLELLFFLRTWALSHPGLAFELVENVGEPR